MEVLSRMRVVKGLNGSWDLPFLEAGTGIHETKTIENGNGI